MYERTSDFHRVSVTDNNGVRLLKFERNQQSSMRIDDPYETDIEYVAYFHLTLALKPDARRVLVIGLGGGSLVKRMWRDYPELTIDAVEIDPEVAEVAHELFEVPRDEPRVHVHVGDGRDYLQGSDTTYDIIVVDAFDDDHIPAHLLTEEFMRELRDHLAEDGAIAYNVIGSVHGDHSKAFRSLHRTASNVWRRIWVFPVGLQASGPILLAFGCNIVMLATDADVDADELLRRIGQRVDGRVTVASFAGLGKDLYQGAIRTGDVPILTDPPKGRRRS
jgi:spermidine synthase